MICLRDRLAEGHGQRDDAGYTALEMVWTMTIMVIFMGMFTGGMLLITNTATQVQAVAETSAQANTAFLRLDKEVRYATAISTPAFDASAGMWHVEWDSTAVSRTAAVATPVETCTQLRIDPVADRLQLRRWTVTASGYASLTAWTNLANKVTNGTTAAESPAPFDFPDASQNTAQATVGMQQLTIYLVTASPSVTNTTTTTSTYTFTALNSAGASSAGTCRQVSVGAMS